MKAYHEQQKEAALLEKTQHATALSYVLSTPRAFTYIALKMPNSLEFLRSMCDHIPLIEDEKKHFQKGVNLDVLLLGQLFKEQISSLSDENKEAIIALEATLHRLES